IEDLDRWLGEARDRIGMMDAELEVRQGRIGGLETALADQMRWLDEANQRIGVMDAELDARQGRVLGLEVHLSEQQGHAAMLAMELQRMRESRSWRVTAPLRGATTFARRVRRLLGNGFRALRFIAANPG